MIARTDHETNYPEDAASFERARGLAYDHDPRPTRAELEADEAQHGGRR